MTIAANANPSQAEVRAAMDTLYLAEPDASVATWRPAFDKLSAALNHARSVRNKARYGVAALAIVVGLVLHFLFWSTPPDADAIARAKLVPTMAEVGWVPHEFRTFAFILGAGALIVEFATSKVYAALGSENSVVSLLRYFGSKVQDEEAFS